MLKKTIVFAALVGLAFTVNIPAPASALQLCISHKHTGTGRGPSKRTAKVAARAKWRFEVLLHGHASRALWRAAKNKRISCHRRFGIYKCKAKAIPCIYVPKIPVPGAGKGKYFKLRNVLPGFLGRCLDVAGGVNANRTNVQIFNCNGSKSQQWRRGSNRSIRSNTGGRCLTVAGGVNANRTNVQIFDCNGSKSQQWTYNLRSKEIRNALGRCLELAGGVNANRRNVQIFDCNGTSSQQWAR